MTETVTARRGQMAAPTPVVASSRGSATEPRPTIAMVGAGRAGGALAVAMASAGLRVVAISGRDPGRAAALAERVGARSLPTALAALRSAGLTFLTVPDAAVTPLAAELAASGSVLRDRGVVHCSASLGIEALAALRLAGAAIGRFHPLQALAGPESAPLLQGVLIAIDADPVLRAPLYRVALDLGGHPVTLPADARALYHAAAVLAGNAPLALLSAATELLVAAGLEPQTAEQGLLALMEGALSNARRLGAREALTGPVVRGDSLTVASHLAALKDRPELGALYRVVTHEILRLAGADGREEIADLLNGHRQGVTGLRVERRLAAGGSRNAAEPREPNARPGVRTPAPQRSPSPAPPLRTEDHTCP